MKLNTMKNLFKLSGYYLSVNCILLFCPQYLCAQNIKKGDTSYAKWQNSLVHVQSIYTSKELSIAKDTLIGTAFLINDHNKLYLVTNKHLLQADLYGKNEQLANDSVFIFANHDFKGNFNISGLGSSNKAAVVFTDDEEDIAIISLQKKEYAPIAAYLLGRGKPVPIGMIDTGNNRQSGEWLMQYGYSAYKAPKSWDKGNIHLSGIMVNGVGLGVRQIDQYDPSASFFIIKSTPIGKIMPGENGGPVIANDKLIGILSNATGIVSNHDIVQTPYYTIPTGRVIKAAYIVRCLRKLQQIEDTPGFNN
jgi:hypothetical protein